MGMRFHLKSNTICYGFILAAFIFSVFISIANFAKLKGSLNIRVLQYIMIGSIHASVCLSVSQSVNFSRCGEISQKLLLLSTFFVNFSI